MSDTFAAVYRSTFLLYVKLLCSRELGDFIQWLIALRGNDMSRVVSFILQVFDDLFQIVDGHLLDIVEQQNTTPAISQTPFHCGGQVMTTSALCIARHNIR